MKEQTLAIFDFDYTLTDFDSFLYFLYFSTSWYKKLKSISLIPMLTLCLFGFISRSKAKEKIFSFFFKNVEENYFNKLARDFSLNKLDNIIKREAFNKFLLHKKNNHITVIASASIKNWIKPWADKVGFDYVVATEVEIINNKITGIFKNGNYSGENKLSQVKSKFPNLDNYTVYVYTDSLIDKPLLDIADRKFLNKF